MALVYVDDCSSNPTKEFVKFVRIGYLFIGASSRNVILPPYLPFKMKRNFLHLLLIPSTISITNFEDYLKEINQ